MQINLFIMLEINGVLYCILQTSVQESIGRNEAPRSKIPKSLESPVPVTCNLQHRFRREAEKISLGF